MNQLLGLFALITCYSIVKAQSPDSCLYTTTHCACAVSTNAGLCARYSSGDPSAASCYIDDCKSNSYVCECSGLEICEKTPCDAWVPNNQAEVTGTGIIVDCQYITDASFCLSPVVNIHPNPPAPSQTPAASASAAASETPAESPSAAASMTSSISRGATASELPSESTSAAASMTTSMPPGATASETPAESPSAAATETLAASASAAASETPSESTSAAASMTTSMPPGATASETPAESPSAAASMNPSMSPGATASETPAASSSVAASETPFVSASAAAGETPSVLASASASQSPSESPSISAIQSPFESPSASVSQSASATPGASYSTPPETRMFTWGEPSDETMFNVEPFVDTGNYIRNQFDMTAAWPNLQPEWNRLTVVRLFVSDDTVTPSTPSYMICITVNTEPIPDDNKDPTYTSIVVTGESGQNIKYVACEEKICVCATAAECEAEAANELYGDWFTWGDGADGFCVDPIDYDGKTVSFEISWQEMCLGIQFVDPSGIVKEYYYADGGNGMTGVVGGDGLTGIDTDSGFMPKFTFTLSGDPVPPS